MKDITLAMVNEIMEAVGFRGCLSLDDLNGHSDNALIQRILARLAHAVDRVGLMPDPERWVPTCYSPVAPTILFHAATVAEVPEGDIKAHFHRMADEYRIRLQTAAAAWESAANRVDKESV